MRFIIPFILVAATASCNSSAESQKLITGVNDTVVLFEKQVEDHGVSVLDSNTTQVYEIEDKVKSAKLIEKKYGKQWDFCDCIYKTDSIQKVIEADGEMSDSDFDALMARFDVIDQHCKDLISSPNTSPEERKAHARKVKKCLKKK